jgi:hypothetical protein
MEKNLLFRFNGFGPSRDDPSLGLSLWLVSPRIEDHIMKMELKDGCLFVIF